MPAREPAFWAADATGPAGWLLAPLGWAYGLAVRARFAATTAQRATPPVICIGNPLLGGGGKTPTVIAVVTRLAALGATPHVQSRGYGGRLAGPVTVDPTRHEADDVGDEPLLLARRCPVHVARDRWAGVEAATAAGADVIVMDDGYQNPTVAKDAGFLVVDGRFGLGNGRVFPAGPLREPIGPQIARATAAIVIGDGEPGSRFATLARKAGIEVLIAHLTAKTTAPDLDGLKVLAFCAIARPEKFRVSLEDVGADVADMMVFPDHHAFGARDVEAIVAKATALVARPVTTEKDQVRLNDINDPGERLRSILAVLPVEVAFSDPERLDALLCAAMNRRPDG